MLNYRRLASLTPCLPISSPYKGVIATFAKGFITRLQILMLVTDGYILTHSRYLLFR